MLKKIKEVFNSMKWNSKEDQIPKEFYDNNIPYISDVKGSYSFLRASEVLKKMGY